MPHAYRLLLPLLPQMPIGIRGPYSPLARLKDRHFVAFSRFTRYKWERFRTVGNRLLDRVPMETFADRSGDIEQVADCRGSDAGLQMRNRFFAGINAVDPVRFMPPNLYLAVFLQIFLNEFRRMGNGAPPENFELSFFADEYPAAAIGVVQPYGQTVRVSEGELRRRTELISPLGRFRLVINRER